jgi:hypothetical protein
MNLKINKKMKPKIYSIATIAFMALMACGNVIFAQQAPATPQAPAAQPAPEVHVYGQGFAYATPQVYVVSPQEYLNPLQSTDTTYTKKMQKLREQMRSLQKEMSDLNREEYKKDGATANLRSATRLRSMNLRLDSTFSRSFNRSFSNNFRFNFETSDANLEKKVQSGEIKEKIKNYTKSYPADGNDKLEIDNRYGKVTVTTWNKNEFKVDVQIKAFANDDVETQKLLDQTSVTDNKENNLVSFKTVINSGSNSNTFWESWSSNGKTSVHKMIVNYTVYMPAKSAVSITNRYGLIDLPTLSGKVTINNVYGGLKAKSLTNTDNVINVKYGNANIGNLEGSDLNVSYGSLNLDVADKVNAVISYGPAKIGKLGTSGTFTLHYGDGLQISDLGKNLKSLSINSSFAPVLLNLTPATNADFDVVVNNTFFTYGDNAISLTSKVPGDDKQWSTTRAFKGHIGKGNTDKVITIKSNYGTVKFE